MTKSPREIPEDEVNERVRDTSRMDALRATGLLDSPPEHTFDRLVDLAAKLLDVPVAVVTLVEPERQFFLAQHGIADPWASKRGTPISHSFCKYVVAESDDLIVDDARSHPTVRENPAIDELDVKAYAGTPLKLSSGEVLGSFCAIDHAPRHWSQAQIDALRTLADAAMSEVELRLATRELREREARFRGALERVSAFAVALDNDSRITFVNDYFLETTGWSRDDVIGHDWFDFVPTDEETRTRTRRAISAGKVAAHNEGAIVTRSGEQRVVAWDNIPLRDADGRASGIAGIGHDVTVQRQAERLKNELIGIVSHELRGPLTSIRASLKLVEVQAASFDDRSRRMVEIASRNSDRLVAVLNDLLELDRLESGEMPMHPEAVSVRRVIDEACDATLPIADEAGVEIRSDCDCDDHILVDVGRSVQALTNLIRNAISFSPKGAAVDVSAQRRDGEIAFIVRDRGRGIPPEQLDTIFERFKQVHVSDSRERVGTGLGLAITRAIVEQQGGTIGVQSQVGTGSAFRITFPRVEGH